jgi:hypothetical protein
VRDRPAAHARNSPMRLFSYAMQLRLSPRRLQLLCRSMYIVASLET